MNMTAASYVTDTHENCNHQHEINVFSQMSNSHFKSKATPSSLLTLFKFKLIFLS